MRLFTTVIPVVRSSLVVYDRQYLDEKQNEFLFLLFEVYMTLGFKSEVSAFIYVIFSDNHQVFDVFLTPNRS